MLLGSLTDTRYRSLLKHQGEKKLAKKEKTGARRKQNQMETRRKELAQIDQSQYTEISSNLLNCF